MANNELEKEFVVGNWEPVVWGSKDGFGMLLDSVAPGEKEQWAVSITLPPDADPAFIRLDYSNSAAGPNQRPTDQYVVNYKIKGKLIWEIILVPVNSGNKKIARDHFGVHADEEAWRFERQRMSSVSSGRT